jgi:isochorismate synthase
LPSLQPGSPRSRRRDEDVQVDDLLPRREWEALVEDAARACRTGVLEKVVLARAVRACARVPFDPAAALERLRDAYPNAYVFAVARGPRCFLGATPERLVRLRDGAVDAACLAGSARRGETPEEDARLGSALLASAKDRAEHAVVVRSVRAALEDVCREVHSPHEPRLLRLRNVQHLYTPVDGGVSWPTCVLDLVQRLHPTPAVGGYPREGALRFIREREGLDRGWYAGPVGWLDRRGDGEFAVALRSALVHGAEATLFAGSGIVAQSRASDEYAETCLKLHPMLNALGTEAVGDRGTYRRLEGEDG